MRIWKIIIGLGLSALALAAAASVALPAVVQAQSATPTPEAGSPTKPWRGGHFGHGRSASNTLISAAASVTGLTTDEVKTQLQSGQSLAQIAEAKDKSADEVIEAARALLNEQLAQSVTDGRLTQAQADARLQQFDAQAETIVNDATLGESRGFGPGVDQGYGEGFRPRQGGHFGHGRSASGALISAAASVTGLTADEVKTQLQSGQSLAQIAEAKDKSADEVIEAARALLNEQLTQSVTDGRLTQAQADARLQQFDAQAETIVNDATLGQAHPGCPADPSIPTPTEPNDTVQPLQDAPGGDA